MIDQARDWARPAAAAEEDSQPVRLEELLEQPPAQAPVRSEAANQAGAGVVVGRLITFGEQGEPRVVRDGDADSMAVPARSTVPLDHTAVGQEVVLVFEGGDRARPIILGVIRPAEPAPTEPSPKASGPIEVLQDGERVVLSADREIVLRCGEASITLTRAGKILLRGTYVLSRSSGANLIKGGSVQIN